MKNSINTWFEKLNSKKHFNTTLANAAHSMGIELDCYSITCAGYYDEFKKNWRMSKAWLSYLAEISNLDAMRIA